MKWTKVKHLKLGMKIGVPTNSALASHWKNSSQAEHGAEKGQGDILWDEIVSIKKLPAERVYDIEVEGTHNFIGGHLIDKQTGEKLNEQAEKKILQETRNKKQETNNNQTSRNNNQKVSEALAAKSGNLGSGDSGTKELEQEKGLAAKSGNLGSGTFFGGIYAHNTYLAGNATTTGYIEVGAPIGESGVGDVNISGFFHTNGADYAEYFYSADKDLQAGEVVSVDVLRPNAVKRTERARDPNVIGIVSSKPAIVGNNDKASQWGKNAVMVGLLGQVSAKVTTENGQIRPGDSLTSASIPGYVMKADAGDSTVGVALEEFREMGEIGEIRVLISRRNKSLTVEEVEEKVQERIAAMEIEDEVNLMIAGAMDNLGLEERMNEMRLAVTDLERKFGDLKVLGQFEDLSAARLGVAAGINLAGDLQLQDASQILFANFGLSLDESGQLVLKPLNASSSLVLAVKGEIKADKVLAEQVEADKAVLSELVLGREIRGFGDAATSTTATSTDDRRSVSEPAFKDEVRVKVVENDLGQVNLSVNAGAKFDGQVEVKDLVVTGQVVVYEKATFKKDVAIKGSLELAGAIIKEFKLASDIVLAVGDMVYISDSGMIDRAFADNPSFKPAIGIVVEIPRIDADSAVLRSADSRRLVRVAIAGSVGGFKDLVPGARYYLADLNYYYQERDALTGEAESLSLASLRPDKPAELGSVIQPIGVALSESEILLMPSLSYEILGGRDYNFMDFANSYEDKSFMNLVEDLKDADQDLEPLDSNHESEEEELELEPAEVEEDEELEPAEELEVLTLPEQPSMSAPEEAAADQAVIEQTAEPEVGVMPKESLPDLEVKPAE